MSKTAVFIDGGYFAKILEKQFNSPRIDFSKLSAKICGDECSLLRTYYYNCMPYKQDPPSIEEAKRYSNMQKFVDALMKLQRFDVRLGKLEYRGLDINNKPIFQQKRVDILLGCDLVLLSAKNRISKAVIITGDSDFIPAIEIAKNEGVETVLFHSNAYGCVPHQSLMQAVDVRNLITQELINQVLQ